MPQLSVRSGCKYYFTNKIASNHETVFPTGAFNWYSRDGSHMLSFWAQGGFHVPGSWPKFKHVYRMLKPGETLDFDYSLDKPEDLDVWSDEYIPVIGQFYGRGDGGHGPTAEEWAWVRAFIALGKNVAATKAIEFYKELETVQDRLPNFHDELFYEYHQGTLTTQHLVKYMNRHQEWGLQSAENLAALATILTGAPYPYERLTRMWKNACTLQMHDILPGSSIPEVYDDNYDLWTIFKKWTDEIRAKTIEKLALNAKLEKGTSGIFVCNPLPVNRSDLIEIPWKCQENLPEFVKISEDLIQPIQFISEDDPFT